MSKIHQHNEIIEEVAEYIEANDFIRSNENVGSTLFVKANKMICIYADKVSFRIINPGDMQGVAEYASLDGISILDFKGWVNLLDAVKMISIKESIRNYKKQALQNIDLKLSQGHSGHIVNLAESIFSNVKTMLIIVVASLFLLTSCNSQRQVQMQKGTCKIIDGRIYFVANTTWNQISFDTTFNGFRVRNTSVRKTK